MLRSGDILFLSGALGTGKSVFARALIRALSNNPNIEVPSPTFTLVQSYEGQSAEISHFDLYRLNDPEEVYALGWEDALSGGIVLVEWPERLGTSLAPARRLELVFEHNTRETQERTITLTPFGEWGNLTL